MLPVILIGGASACGKSSVSGPLASRLGIGLTPVDDLMLAVRCLTTPEQQPALHAWNLLEDHSRLTPEDILDMHIASARALQPAVEAVVTDHLEFGVPFVLEGDSLLPELASRPALAAAFASGQVRMVFIEERDEKQLLENYLQREPWAGEQTFRAGMSGRVGRWLRAEAEQVGVPVMPARPWSSVLERIMAALDLAL